MTGVQFFEDAAAVDFYPLTALRELADLPWGGRSLRDQWTELLGSQCPAIQLNARWIPSAEAAAQAAALGPDGRLVAGDVVLALRGAGSEVAALAGEADLLRVPEELFERCGEALEGDLAGLCRAWGAQATAQIPSHVTLIGPPDRLFVAPGARLLGCTLNTEYGSIVVGPGAEISEGATVRGPLALGPGAVLKMGARIYGPSSFGPECRVGGEVSNTVMVGWTNKGHDGFVGSSVLGAWCNLGAGTTTSNLKNTYGEVRIYRRSAGQPVPSGRNFCGVIMGDHVKCGIGTLLNTATVIGTGAQLFGTGLPPKHVPAFVWGGAAAWSDGEIEAILKTAERMLARRGEALSTEQRERIVALHARSAAEREAFLKGI